jgi:SAM-dependent methyltransferase
MSQNTLSPPLFDLDAVFEVDDYMHVYRDDLNAERSDTEVASLVALLDLYTPMRILDLACGFGRHTNRLAALGHTVTGVDLMPGFLDIARQQAVEMGVQVDYRQGDMRRLDFPQAFDRVLLLFASFGYFEDAENVQVLEAIARALKPGGLLCFDIPNRDTVLKDVPAAHVTDRDGDLTIDRLSFDPLSGRMHNHRIVIRDGIRKDKPFSIRLYSATEIRDLVNRAGLRVNQIVDSNSEPLSATSRRMVVVARKSSPA